MVDQLVQQARAQLEGTLTAFGPEVTRQAASELMGAIITPPLREMPAELYHILSPAAVIDTKQQLDACVSDLLEKGSKREQAYDGKKALIGRKYMLETAIQLKESEAFMNNMDENGKTGILPNGSQFPLNNDTNRDIFRKLHSAVERKQLGEVEAELKTIEIDAMQARDSYETAVSNAEIVKSKAFLQANLLRFISGGL